jgi:uncharacterized membrane protein
MNSQQTEALKRAGILAFAMILPGLIAVYPSILGDAPIDAHALIRSFVAAVMGGLLSRFGEGVFDGHRASTGDVIKGDVTHTPTS